jgi:hypothetical protein
VHDDPGAASVRFVAAVAVTVGVAAAAGGPAIAGTRTLQSPNGHPGRRQRRRPLSYDVLYDGKPLLRAATLSLDVDHARLGIAPRHRGARQSVSRTITPPVRQKAPR